MTSLMVSLNTACVFDSCLLLSKLHTSCLNFVYTLKKELWRQEGRKNEEDITTIATYTREDVVVYAVMIFF